jgi:hypothetical protein
VRDFDYIGTAVGVIMAGVPVAIVAGFASQWWHPALWIGVAALLPGLLLAIGTIAGFTLALDRTQFWIGGMLAIGGVTLLLSGMNGEAAIAMMATAAGLRAVAECSAWAVRQVRRRYAGGSSSIR